MTASRRGGRVGRGRLGITEANEALPTRKDRKAQVHDLSWEILDGAITLEYGDVYPKIVK